MKNAKAPAPVKQWLIAALLAAALVLAWDRWVLESILVPSGSMEPTILAGERLLVWKWPAWISPCSTLKRFDIVVIKIPGKPHRLIKRVIGLPGERVVLRDGYRVEINGRLLDLAPDNSGPGRFRELEPDSGRGHLMQTVNVGRFHFETRFGQEPGICLNRDEYFVLGDHRWRSDDSRVFGPVRRDEIDGVAWRIWMSMDPCASHKLRRERIGMKLQ
jgi:signal peptidase I